MCLCYVLSRECLYDLSNTLTYITVCSTSLMYHCSLDLIRLCSGNNTLLSASCTSALLADAAVCLTDDGTVYNRWAAVPTHGVLYGGLLHTPNISTKTLL